MCVRSTVEVILPPQSDDGLFLSSVTVGGISVSIVAAASSTAVAPPTSRPSCVRTAGVVRVTLGCRMMGES